MCEECGYAVLHGLRCPQRQHNVTLRCRICDGVINEKQPHLLLRRHPICFDCAEEMDLHDIKEIFRVGTLELIALLCAAMGKDSPIRISPTTEPLIYFNNRKDNGIE